MERIVKITEDFLIAIDDAPIETDICLRYVDDIPYIMKYDKGIETKQYNITHSTLPLEEEVVGVTPDGQDYIKNYVFDKIKKLDVLEILIKTE